MLSALENRSLVTQRLPGFRHFHRSRYTFAPSSRHILARARVIENASGTLERRRSFLASGTTRELVNDFTERLRYEGYRIEIRFAASVIDREVVSNRDYDYYISAIDYPSALRVTCLPIPRIFLSLLCATLHRAFFFFHGAT